VLAIYIYIYGLVNGSAVAEVAEADAVAAG